MDFFQQLFSTSDAISTITMIDMTRATLLSFALTMVVGFIYRLTHQGPSYSQTTIHTMVIMAVVVSLIMLIIGTNIARAFSLVGALSIIRFRNAVKESRDVAFYFLAMSIGMACGTGFAAIATVFTLFASSMIYCLARFDVGAKKVSEVLLRMTVDESVDYHNVFKAVFYNYLTHSDLLSVDSDGAGQFELVYNVTFRRGTNEQGLLSEIRQIASARPQLIYGHTNVNI